MRRSMLVFVLLLVAPGAGVALPGPDAPAAPHLTGEYRVVSGVPVLRLWGTPRERGFAQGYLLAREIVDGTNRAFERFLGDDIGRYTSSILPLAGMGFRFTEAEIAEMEGIVQGVRARLPEAERRLTALDREPALADLKALNTFGDWFALGCSSLALWGEKTKDTKAVVVRNFDFPAFGILAEHQHLRIVYPPPGAKGILGWAGICHPGGIGALTAMNREGVFVSIHDVDVKGGMKDVLQGNVPRLAAIRRLVELLPARGAVEAAAARCRGWNTLYGSNFLVATPEPGDGLPAGVLEYDTREQDDRGVDLRGPDEGTDGEPLRWIACSNHFRIRGRGSCPRYARLMAGAAAIETPLSPDELFVLGSRAAVPGPGGKISDRNFGTLHQVVAFTGEKVLRVRLAKGVENIRDATPVRFSVTELLDEPTGRRDE